MGSEMCIRDSRDTNEKERERQAWNQAQRERGSSRRSTTYSFSTEETAARREMRNQAAIEGRGAATATAQTATMDDPAKHQCIARLYGEAAFEVMKSKPQRLPHGRAPQALYHSSPRFGSSSGRHPGAPQELPQRLEASTGAVLGGNESGIRC